MRNTLGLPFVERLSYFGGIYIIILDPNTSFKLISDFFHVNQGVLCCEHAEQASSRGVLEGGGGGGGGNRLAK